MFKTMSLNRSLGRLEDTNAIPLDSLLNAVGGGWFRHDIHGGIQDLSQPLSDRIESAEVSETARAIA